MIGGCAFILLKGARAGPESAKQAEIRLANLLKILSVSHPAPGHGGRAANARSGTPRLNSRRYG
jgi:hypothetical protein